MTTTCSTTSTAPVTHAGAGALTVIPSSTGFYDGNFKAECFSSTNGFVTDVIQKISKKLLANSDFTGCMAWARTSVQCYIATRELVSKLSLVEFCPGLRICNAKTYTFTDGKELCINKLRVAKCFFKLAPFVEGGAKLTIVLNKGGLTLNQVLADAKSRKISVNIPWGRILEELGDLPEEDLRMVMISNATVTETHNKLYKPQEVRVQEVGFHDMPTLIEYLVVCISTQEMSQLKICLYGQDPATYGRSSTHVDDKPLLVGSSSPGRLHVYHRDFENRRDGAGGRRKFL